MLPLASTLIACLAPAPQQSAAPEEYLLPITAPFRTVRGTLDTATGEFRRHAGLALGSSGAVSVYDNTCATAFYLGLEPAGGSGSAFGEALGDYGAIPADTFAGDGDCTPGCASAYTIDSFEIRYCTVTTPQGGATAEIYFWNTPHAPCVLGTAPGNNPFGGTIPPTTPPVFSTVLEGLPRTSVAGTLGCYSLTIELDQPFTLSGSQSFVSGQDPGDKFAWSFSMPTSTGLDGPVLAGDLTAFTAACAPCEGTIWQVGGQTTNEGTGGGQSNHIFWEDFGGTSIPQGSGDCYFFGSQVPTGIHLQLFADDPCGPPLGTAFCDASDGSLGMCPCANPGAADTGCDIAQATGGVRLSAVAQETSPKNRVTLEGEGFPTTSAPTVVVMRSDELDVGGPIVFGDGLRCVASTVVRMSGSFASGGTSTHVVGHGAASGDFFYQLWFRNTPPGFCTPDAFNVSSGRALTW